MPITIAYPARVDLPSKFPFWSAIILQSQGSVSVAAGSTVVVDIQPPVGETWLIDIVASTRTDAGYRASVQYLDFDGTTARLHVENHVKPGRGEEFATPISVQRVLTNTLYGRLSFYRDTSGRGNYGYSGFKLSKPHWTPSSLNNTDPKPWKRKRKRKLKRRLPKRVAALKKYGFEVYVFEIDDYVPAIMVEENVPLAIDPNTGFPVERKTVYVLVDDLIRILDWRDNPRLRPDQVIEDHPKYRGRNLRDLSKDEFEDYMGWKTYFEKWRNEGINI